MTGSNEDRWYLVRLNAVLVNTFVRNFVSCFPAHNSRCAKCIQSGRTVNEQWTFQDKDLTLRTNETFREGLLAAYEHILSPFEVISIDIVNNFLSIICTCCI